MSDVDQLEQRLRELKGERDGLLATRTKEACAEAARTFLEGARARSQDVGAHVVSGYSTVIPLADVLRAYLLRDPGLEAWLVEQAEAFAELTAKQRDGRVRKLDGEIGAVEKDLLTARKAAAMAQLEAEFADAAA